MRQARSQVREPAGGQVSDVVQPARRQARLRRNKRENVGGRIAEDAVDGPPEQVAVAAERPRHDAV